MGYAVVLGLSEHAGPTSHPSGVKEERYRHPRWLGNYSFSKIKFITLPIAELLSMQYVHALDRLLHFFGRPRPGTGLHAQGQRVRRFLPHWTPSW